MTFNNSLNSVFLKIRERIRILFKIIVIGGFFRIGCIANFDHIVSFLFGYFLIQFLLFAVKAPKTKY
jgi:hypothetical protein